MFLFQFFSFSHSILALIEISWHNPNKLLKYFVHLWAKRIWSPFLFTDLYFIRKWTSTLRTVWRSSSEAMSRKFHLSFTFTNSNWQLTNWHGGPSLLFSNSPPVLFSIVFLQGPHMRISIPRSFSHLAQQYLCYFQYLLNVEGGIINPINIWTNDSLSGL